MSDVYVPEWLKETFKRAALELMDTPKHCLPFWLEDWADKRDQHRLFAKYAKRY